MNSFLLPKEELIYYVTLRCKWSSSSEGREGSNFWFGVFYIWCLTVQCENDASALFFFFFHWSREEQLGIKVQGISSRYNLNFPLLVRIQSWFPTEASSQPMWICFHTLKKHRAIYAFLVGEPQPQSVVLEIVLT